MAKTDATSQQITLLHERVKQLVKSGQSQHFIIQELGKEGLSPDYVETILANLEDDRSDRKSFRNSLIMGGFYIGAGSLLNILSYTAATEHNSSTFLLFWGILVLGIVTIVRGFILYKR